MAIDFDAYRKKAQKIDERVAQRDTKLAATKQGLAMAQLSAGRKAQLAASRKIASSALSPTEQAQKVAALRTSEAGTDAVRMAFPQKNSDFLLRFQDTQQRTKPQIDVSNLLKTDVSALSDQQKQADILKLQDRRKQISGTGRKLEDVDTRYKTSQEREAIDKKIKELQGDKPFWQDMFSKDETYVDLAKKRDIAGAAANFIGTGLQGAQSLYLNLWNTGDALLSGEKPTFHYNMDKEELDKEMARRHFDGRTTGEKISAKNAGLGLAYSMANEFLSDPTSYITGGGIYDAFKASGKAKTGSGLYMDALQKGTLSQVPKAGTVSRTAESAQDASQVDLGMDLLPEFQKASAGAETAGAAKTADNVQKAQKAAATAEEQLATARKAAEDRLEAAKAVFRNYYAEYRSTTPETRRAGLLDDAKAADKELKAAQAQADKLAQQAETMQAAKAVREAAAREAEAAAQAASTRAKQVLQVADGMDPQTVHRADLNALREIGETNPMIAAMGQNYRMAEAQQAELFRLYKQMESAESLDDALRIQKQIDTAQKRLDDTRGILERAQQGFQKAAREPQQAELANVNTTEQAGKQAAQAAGKTANVAASEGFRAGDRVWAADRNNYGVIEQKNASGTFDVTFWDSRTGSTKTVELSGDTIQRLEPLELTVRRSPDALPDFASSSSFDPTSLDLIPRQADELPPLELKTQALGRADTAGKARVAAKNAGEDDPRGLKDAAELVKEIDYDAKSGLETLGEGDYWRLENPKGAYSKDISRVLDAAAGKNKTLREKLRNALERPLMKAKSNFANGVKDRLNQYYQDTKALGIRQGSRESAAVQWYGEGYRVVKGEKVPYGLAELQHDFPDKWQNIQKMDGINRRIYDDYLHRLNAALEKIYPNVEENAKHQLTVLQARRDGLQNKVKALQDGLQAAPGNRQYAKELQGMMQAVKENDSEIIKLQRAMESGEIFRNKKILARKDYYHHWQEMDSGLSAIPNIFQTSADIDPRLVGVSDWTKPNTKWAGFLQRRQGIDDAQDSVGGMIRYIQAAEYKINIDPEIARLRVAVRDLQNGTVETKNANNLIEWLTDFTNDLAGKTNPIDRGVQKAVPGGRKMIKGLRWLNNRVKGNAVLGNLSSMVSQVYNLPNVVAYVKNPADLAAGAARAAGVTFGNKKSKNLLAKSGFLTERYLDHAVRQFDEGILKTPEKFAGWMLEIGDRKIAETSWFAAYRQAERKGIANAAEYADDLTRRAIAGRGIGEVPLMQKSELVKFFAPFQVEVNNAYQLLKEKVKQKDALGLVEMFATTWLMNEVRKNFIDGRTTGFDPVHAAQDATQDIQEQEGKDGKTLSLSRKIGTYAGRLSGELLSNMPGGDQIARTVLGLDESTAKKFFGEGDPTRFGTGNIGLSMLTAPITDLATGKQVDYLEPIANILPSFGGAQLNRTRKAAEDLGIIPKLRHDPEQGFVARKQTAPGAYTDDNTRLKYPIDATDKGNAAKALTFGSTATKEGQAYLNGGAKMLSDTATKNFDALVSLDLKPQTAFDTIRKINALEPVKGADGKTKESTTAQARSLIMDMDVSPGIKRQIDRQLVAGTEPNDNGTLPRTADYNSAGELKAFNKLVEATYEKAKQANAQGISYDKFLKVYESFKAVEKKKDAGTLQSSEVNPEKRQILAGFDIPAKQKNLLDDLLINDVTIIPKDVNVDYSTPDTMAITQMSEAAQGKWQKAQKAGFTSEEYANAWGALGKVKTGGRKARIAAVQQVTGLPAADAAFFADLYTERTK